MTLCQGSNAVPALLPGRPAIRVLFRSGYGRPNDAQGWPNASIEVIAKPFTRPTLLVRIQQAMAAGMEQAAKPRVR